MQRKCGDDCKAKDPCQAWGECKDKCKEKCGDDRKNPCRGEVKDNAKKNVQTIVKIHVQLEVNVKINAKKNVETSGDNCKDPRRARGESKHECKENWGYDCKNPLSMSNSWRMKNAKKNVDM